MLDVVHHFKQHNSWGRTKMERKDGIKTRVQVFQCILCNVFFTFETDAAGKYLSPKMSTEGFPFNHAICVYKYLNRSLAILNMTVTCLINLLMEEIKIRKKVTIYLF